MGYHIRNFLSNGIYMHYKGEVKHLDDFFVVQAKEDFDKYNRSLNGLVEIVDGSSLVCLYEEHGRPECKGNMKEIKTKVKIIQARINSLYEFFGFRPEILKTRQKRQEDDDDDVDRQQFPLPLQTNFQNKKNSGRIDDLSSIVNKHEIMLKLLNDQNKISVPKFSVVYSKSEALNGNFTSLLKQLSESYNVNSTIQICNELLLSLNGIKSEIDHLDDCIRDLRNGEICNSFISPAEIIDQMERFQNKSQFIENPAITNYKKLSESFLMDSQFNPQDQILTIYIKIPFYKPEVLHLYEIINVPIIRNGRILRLKNSANYCVLSENKDRIYCMEEQHQFRKDPSLDLYYLDDMAIHLVSTSNKDVCIYNILQGRSLENCKFQEVSQNIEIFEELTPDEYLFALRDHTKYTFDCGTDGNNFSTEHFFGGVGLLYLDPNCEFSTEYSTLKTNFIKITRTDKDLYDFGNELEFDELFETFEFNHVKQAEKVVITFKGLEDLKNHKNLAKNEQVFTYLGAILAIVIILIFIAVGIIIFILNRRKNTGIMILKASFNYGDTSM